MLTLEKLLHTLRYFVDHYRYAYLNASEDEVRAKGEAVKTRVKELILQNPPRT